MQNKANKKLKRTYKKIIINMKKNKQVANVTLMPPYYI